MHIFSLCSMPATENQQELSLWIALGPLHRAPSQQSTQNSVEPATLAKSLKALQERGINSDYDHVILKK